MTSSGQVTVVDTNADALNRNKTYCKQLVVILQCLRFSVTFFNWTTNKFWHDVSQTFLHSLYPMLRLIDFELKSTVIVKVNWITLKNYFNNNKREKATVKTHPPANNETSFWFFFFSFFGIVCTLFAFLLLSVIFV